MSNFGVIVVCSEGDYIFAKGCCASVKHFMPEVPLSLLIDGEFDLEGLPETYDAIVIKREDIKDEFLRNNSFGWGKTRLISFWESPFKKFLIVDADTTIWGDIHEFVNYEDFDFIIDSPNQIYSKDDINKWFFDIKEIEKYFPDFDYMNNPYVCPAVLFGTKNVFPMEEYRSILYFVNENPYVFKFGDMGFLNYLLFKLSKEEKIKLGSLDIQYITCDYAPEDTKKRFYLHNGMPYFTGNSTVIHWPGDLKPIQLNPYGYYEYDEPMTFFRKQYLRDSTNLSEREIEREILKEEKLRVRKIKKSRIKLKIFTIAKSIFNMFYSKAH
ncbi:MAG: hypothetical protein ACXAC2_19415 [Candidatus Kariarchaeaceae archaeon]|jgi:hypothetical protein